jgi:hypothetical protein
MKKDIHNGIKVASARNVAAISSNTTSAGNIIDTAGHESVEFLIYSGTITDGSYAPLIAVGNEADLSDAVTVSTDADKIIGTVALATFAAADDNAVKKIGVRADGYRYVRLSLVSTGVSSGGTLGAVALLGHATIEPVA